MLDWRMTSSRVSSSEVRIAVQDGGLAAMKRMKSFAVTSALSGNQMLPAWGHKRSTTRGHFPTKVNQVPKSHEL